jgi:hypothetical protein
MLSNIPIITQTDKLSDVATLALFGFGLLATTFFLKRGIKG